LLLEEETGIRPTHGVIVSSDGTRRTVENTDELRAWVLDIVDQIRAARASVAEPIPVQPVPGQCRPCGMRGLCVQARRE
jgi:CRISPR/Cas system-associated exonuclease Cas4 (RecB family)